MQWLSSTRQIPPQMKTIRPHNTTINPLWIYSRAWQEWGELFLTFNHSLPQSLSLSHSTIMYCHKLSLYQSPSLSLLSLSSLYVSLSLSLYLSLSLSLSTLPLSLAVAVAVAMVQYKVKGTIKARRKQHQQQRKMMGGKKVCHINLYHCYHCGVFVTHSLLFVPSPDGDCPALIVLLMDCRAFMMPLMD